MKKLVIGIIIILNLIIQSTILQTFHIQGVVPNTALILVVCFGILHDKNKGALIGGIIGILQDIIFFPAVGLNALIFMMIGFLIGSINNKIFRENITVPFVFTAVATVFHKLLSLFFIYFMGYQIEILNILKRMLLIEILYNSILSLFIYTYISKFFKTKLVKRTY